MRPLFLLFLGAALCYANTDSNQPKIESLMDNVLVLMVPYIRGRVYVNLTCGEAYQNQPVFWKENGVELKPALQGNHVKVLVVELRGGNYSCHQSPDGRYLNHTTILVQPERDNRSIILQEKSPKGGHIHCSAPNYKGSFHCTWTRSTNRPMAAVLLVTAERDLKNIPCVLDANGSGVHCNDTICRISEEQHSISLTVYIRSYSLLEKHTKTFFLRDIVRPANLPNLHTSDMKVFSWGYPETWDKPCAFFPLQFQVKVVPSGHDCSSMEPLVNTATEQTQYEVRVKVKKFVFCVKAQDKITNGPFNQWSSCKVNKHEVKCSSDTGLQP
ncbi:interleukin-12 subunit beta [Labrus mixtus]|uniref:interleukin-12 subunit beta n=1 Tax=Labrus mixtus TaxID=508554 RepID=UPI0029C09842|nr:interleukin-12 subunit beta [Labrus mixtus]